MFSITCSQNFLRSADLVRTLLQQSSIANEDIVLDIGAGQGIITKELALQAKHVEAIEKDPSFCRELKARLRAYPNVAIRCADFMEYPLPSLDYKVFANIPYARTSDILRKLLDASNPPVDAYLVIQREAAYKYSGRPYRVETLASLSRKPWFNLQIVHLFKKTDFVPAPKVASVLLRIQSKEKPRMTINEKELYLDFLAYGFTSNKPNLKKAYKHIFGYGEFKRLASELGFGLDATPTELTFEQWLGIFRYFVATSPEGKKSVIYGAWQKLLNLQNTIVKRHRTN
jgi:23S rRNA (adenine-N6)-dimethyltransferase